nr:MAG TPA: hypothetical protein [Caudoviricetes sp.]
MELECVSRFGALVVPIIVPAVRILPLGTQRKAFRSLKKRCRNCWMNCGQIIFVA